MFDHLSSFNRKTGSAMVEKTFIAVVVLTLLFIASSQTHSKPPPNRAYIGSFMPYKAFRVLPKTHREVKGGMLEIAFAPGRFELSRTKILAWIERSARALVTYYGRFPVRRVKILIVPVPGRGIKHGKAWGHQGAAIRVLLGTNTSEGNLANDWVMVHEMIHLAWPQMHSRHIWLSEGLSTYVESIARHQAGDLSAEFIWKGFAKAMHQGLPRRGDRGLDFTHSWGRTYWGGALFCMLADIKIRQATNNRYGLQDALRAVVNAGGNNETAANISTALNTGDQATGVPVLQQLYNEMRARAVKPDLVKLWRDLGVHLSGNAIRFDENAPLAHVRRMINHPKFK